MAGNVSVCSVVDAAKASIRSFRFRKAENTAALILKVDREKQEIFVEEELDDISVEDLQEQLPGHQPRYVILSYRRKHSDGRISFPLCLVFYTPRDSHSELQVMYVGSIMLLQREADLSRSFEIRELEELTEEWLLEKLGN